jgi:hypothetical protein
MVHRVKMTGRGPQAWLCAKARDCSEAVSARCTTEGAVNIGQLFPFFLAYQTVCCGKAGKTVITIFPRVKIASVYESSP